MTDEPFKGLGAQFLLRTREDWLAMQTALIKAQSGDAAALNELRILAHRICGSGAMLGFQRIGELSGEIEATLRSAISPATPDWQTLARLLRELDVQITDATDA